MSTFLNYYILTFIFYVIEIYVFKLTLEIWEYDVFWLNVCIRGILVTFFAVIVRKILFADSENFYIKFLFLVISSPLISSILLKILILNNFDIIFNKIIADILSSLIIFMMLKKIS